MPRFLITRILTATTAAVALAALTGCASGVGNAGGSGASDYVTDGKLTVATGEPAYFPYVIDDDPASGKGFEAAVA